MNSLFLQNMDFKLHFNVPASAVKISYRDKFVLMGSCFAENMAAKFDAYKLNSLVNSHGILFNPTSIRKALQDTLTKKEYTAKDIFYFNECWHSWGHHGVFSDPSQENCLNKINTSIEKANVHLKDAQWLFITFGSAFAYRHQHNNEPVANCHKVPQREFEKILLNKDELKNDYLKLIDAFKTFNPKLHIVFTVSPVRYVRDGLIENNLSKSVLIQLVHELCMEKNCLYFPAYELVMDELRDYRFYEKDLVHPNSLAIDYVWEKFRETFFSEETKNIYTQLEELKKACEHRPFHSDTASYKKFRSQVLSRVQELHLKYPFLGFSQFES